jgi:hypothetical protein
MSIANREALHAFLRDTWLTWLVGDATPERGGERTEPPPNSWGVSPLLTQLLFTASQKLLAANELPASFRFDEQSRTLQFERSAFCQLVKQNDAPGLPDAKKHVDEDARDRVLFDKNGLGKRVVRLMRYCGTEWRESKIDWLRILPKNLITETEKLFKLQISDARFNGVLLNGYDEGEHVWALRAADEVCRLMKASDLPGAVEAFFALSPRDRAELLVGQVETDVASVKIAVPTPDWSRLAHQTPEGRSDDPYDLLVLRAINAIFQLDLPSAPRELIQKAVDRFSLRNPPSDSAATDRLDVALLRLSQQLWIEHAPYDHSLQDASWFMITPLPIGFDEIIPNILSEEFNKGIWSVLLKAVLDKRCRHDDLLDAADVLDQWFAQDDLLRRAAANALINYTEFVPPSATRELLVSSAAKMLRRFVNERAGAEWRRIAEFYLIDVRSVASFLDATTYFENYDVARFVKVHSWRLREEFRWIADTPIKDPMLRPAMERLSRGLDRVDFPGKDHINFSETFAHWCEEATEQHGGSQSKFMRLLRALFRKKR